MFRTLILFIAIGVAVWLVSRMLKSKTSQSKSKPQKKQPKEIKNIVQCQLCNVYIPESDAIKHEQLSFCSQDHLEQWKNK